MGYKINNISIAKILREVAAKIERDDRFEYLCDDHLFWSIDIVDAYSLKKNINSDELDCGAASDAGNYFSKFDSQNMLLVRGDIENLSEILRFLLYKKYYEDQ